MLKLESVTKVFGRRLVFENLSLDFPPGKVYGISGPNGSGKSTLSKIIAGIIAPTSGRALHSAGGKIIPAEKLHNHIGFVSPYLTLYDEFTALENIEHFSRIRGIVSDNERRGNLLNDLGIYSRRNDYVKAYSSGMKQRLKYVFALIHRPELILLDEPTSNLDSSGKDAVYKLIENEIKKSVVIIASNEDADLARCGEVIYLEEFKLKQNK